MRRKSYYGKYFDDKEFFDEFMPKEGIEQIETKHIAKYLGYKTSDPIQRLLYEFGLKEKKYDKNTGSRCDYKRYKWNKEKIDKFAKKYNEKYKEPKPTKQRKESPPKYTIKNVIEKMCSIENVVLNEKEKKNLLNRIQVFCRKKLKMEKKSCNDGKKYYDINEKEENEIIKAFILKNGKFKLPFHNRKRPQSISAKKYGYNYYQLVSFINDNDSFFNFMGELKHNIYADRKFLNRAYQFIRKNIDMGKSEDFYDFCDRWEKDDGKEIIKEHTAKSKK
jgi:hypothetical protein